MIITIAVTIANHALLYAQASSAQVSAIMMSASVGRCKKSICYAVLSLTKSSVACLFNVKVRHVVQAKDNTITS